MLSAGRMESSLAKPEKPPSCAEVQVATDDSLKFSDALEVCQGKIADATQASSLVKEVEAAFEFLEKYKLLYVRALQFLEAKTTSLPPTPDSPGHVESFVKSTVSRGFISAAFEAGVALVYGRPESLGPLLGFV